jgi:hypothetical protein
VQAYDVYLAVHVASVVVWVGAAFLMALLGLRAQIGADPARKLTYVQDSEWLGLRLFLPSSAVALASGLLLVQEGSWGYGTLWVLLGIGALALSTVLGMAVFGPGWARIGKLVEDEGVGSDAVHRRMGVILLFGWVDVGLLAGAIWAMVLKPAGDDTGALVVTFAIPVLATLLGAGLVRRRPRLAPSGRTTPAEEPLPGSADLTS